MLIIGGVVGSLVVVTASIFFVVWLMNRDTKVVNPLARDFREVANAGGPDIPPDAGNGHAGDHEDKADKPDPDIKEPPPPPDPPKMLEFIAPPAKDLGPIKPPGPASVELAADVVERVKAATVLLRVTMADGTIANGSGFFAGERNIILTNAHVVGMLLPGTGKPRNIDVFQNSGTDKEKKFSGQLLGVDRSADLAVLRVQATDTPPPLEVKSAANLRQTQKVWVVGFPLGEQLGKEITVSDSSVSSFRRDSHGVLNRVQVNGGMHPGNSGGPVVDSYGNVVGVAVSGYAGTQINFAVPGDYVRTILDGKIAGISLGQPYIKDGAVKMPATLELIDPLKHIKQLALEVWSSEPTPTSRPPSTIKPAVQPGDSPHQRFALERKGDQVQGEVTLAPLETGRAYMIQPTWINAAGKSVWATAQVCQIPAPVDLRPALLEVKHATGDRQLHLNVWTSQRIHDAERGELHYTSNEEAVLTETTQAIDDRTEQANVRLRYKSYNIDYKWNNQSQPLDRRLQRVRKDMRGLTATLQLDKQGNPVGHELDAEHAPVESRGDLASIHTSLQQVLDDLTVPLPNKQVSPGETWKALRLMPHSQNVPWMQVGNLEMTYTYVGARKRDGREEGVITFKGTVHQANGQTGSKGGGQAQGTAVVNLANGQAVQVDGLFAFDFEVAQFGRQPQKHSGTVRAHVDRIPRPAASK
jgi:S1-C subfamily serine protease